MKSLDHWSHPFTPQSLTGQYVRGLITLEQLIELVNERVLAKASVDAMRHLTLRQARTQRLQAVPMVCRRAR